MSKTNYPGINYAMGTGANQDPETGIRYGIASPNLDRLNQEAIQEIYEQGIDLDHAEAISELKSRIKSAIEDYFSRSEVEAMAEAAFEAISDNLNIEPSGDSVRMLYEKDGYKILAAADGDLWVLKSPFTTHAQFCSPCAPGACHLGSPLEEPVEGNCCYCLGVDWFEDGAAPYPITTIPTGPAETL